jgi:PAS domain S-box-containing protein
VVSSEPDRARPDTAPAPDESGRFPTRRADLLDILAAVASMLSRGEQVDLDQTLRLIGQAVGVDRMYLFENHVDPTTGKTLCSQRFEWAHDAVSAEIDNPRLQDLPYDAISDRLEAVLRRGEVFAAAAHELDPEGERGMREVFEAQGIRSACIVPVMIDEELWGFVGFDDCHRTRIWRDEEIAVLRIVAAILGGHHSRERMRSDLAAAARQYRDVVDNVQEVIFECDAEGRLTFLSRAWETTLGHPVEESLGRRFVDFLLPSELERVARDTEATLRDGRAECFHELRFATEDGRERLLQVLCRLRRDDTGAPIGALGTLRDVTEQRCLEERLRQRQLDESLSTLAGGIAHDFNNVLHGLLAATEALERRGGADADELLGVIRTSGERMADLTSQLLAYARGGGYEVAPLAPDRLVSDALTIARGRIPPHVALEVDAPDVDWVVDADRGQLFQVLLNLVMNAVESMRRGGRLGVRIDAVDLAPSDPFAREHRLNPGAYASIEVADDGDGIDEALLPRIFDPYFSTKAQGRGLGLAAAKGIAASHGGTITVQSRRGAGSTFRLLLPRRPAPRGADRAEPRPRPDEGGVVLIVDDEEAILRTTSAALADAGHRVLTARDGAEALRAFDTNRDAIRAALVDYLLPDMNGAEVVAALRERAPDLHVVVCTGYDRAEIGRSATLDGLPVLQKPFGARALRDALVGPRRAAE